MPIGLGAGLAISAGAAALGTGANAIAQGKMNKRAERFNREMFEKQGQRELEYWRLQNEYNSPIAQMQRLQDAGLNPNLVYGNGATAEGGPLRAGGAPSAPNFKASNYDFSNVVDQVLAVKQRQAGIKLTEAQADAVRQNTEVGSFELEARKEIGQSAFTRQLQTKIANATFQDEKAINEYANWLELAYDRTDGVMNIDMDAFHHLPLGGSRMVQDQIRSVTQRAVAEVQNLKSGISLRNQQHSIQELQKIIMKAEADFVKTLGSTKGAGLALQLLRTILGK
ncbi:MAG: DNA pilot protein [Microviridae sp.]|nr:MAG: DNA pilot protein [Microviridae sp.]